MKNSLISLAAVSVLLVGCGDTAPQVTSVNAWRGELTHLAVSGSYEGMRFDVDLQGDDAGVYCNRLYAPLPGTEPQEDGSYDTSQLYFVMKELGGIISLEGEAKEFTISYWRHDQPAGSEMEVIVRQFGSSIPAGQTWSDINIFDPGTNELDGIESAASSGSVAVMLNTGSPDEGGVYIPSGGRTGEFVSVSWGPDDHLNVSATADCVTTPVATWPQPLLVP